MYTYYNYGNSNGKKIVRKIVTTEEEFDQNGQLTKRTVTEETETEENTGGYTGPWNGGNPYTVTYNGS